MHCKITFILFTNDSHEASMSNSSLTLPKILQKSVVACSRFFKIEKLQLKFSNGEEREFERMQGGNAAVLVVPFYDDNTLLLIREYAAGTHSYELGFPKGLVDPGETPVEAANRELKEEVGFGATQFTELKKVVMAPSYFSSEMTLFMATGFIPREFNRR